jgi:hypothetical protein
MGTTAPQQSSLKIPAELLEDVRAALIEEIKDDGEALAGDHGQSDPEVREADRTSSMRILARDLALLEELVNETETITLTAERDRLSDTFRHVLEAVVRVLMARLEEISVYGPMDMVEVMSVGERLIWAARSALELQEVGR